MKQVTNILKSNPKKTLHIYQRVSTEIQKTDGGSLDTQLKNGIKTAEKLKYNYMVWDEGAKSGSRNQEDRNVFNTLMVEVKQGNVKHIYFQDITRSQRNYDYEYLLIKTCMDYECEIHDNGRKYDLNLPQDNFFLRLQSLFGQYENQQRRIRSVMGKRDHFLRGGWRGGITPLGFDTIDRKLVINDEEAKWVKKIFEDYSIGHSTSYISNMLFTKGVKPRKSKSG
ncbi:MAG: recombinase family protein, partial [Candidatus Pelagibacter sp.]|nr:recombinase family protein [Candidatus Pelagibacter sp.]